MQFVQSFSFLIISQSETINVGQSCLPSSPI